MRTIGAVLLAVLLVGAYAAQMARWLRVLQREHYDPSALLRFLARWSSPQVPGAKAYQRAHPRRPFTLTHAFLVVMAGAIVFRAYVILAVAAGLYGLLCPTGLSLRGRTSPLTWTRRLRLTTVVAGGFSVVVATLGAFSAQPFLGAVIMVLAVPPVLDLTTRVLRPLEERSAQKFVDQAVRRLEHVRPTVVAITGSFGKTSTKNYLSALLGPDQAVVASPRSYNNRAGLSRAINENLAEGTKIFIAEMGTYGPGEIRELTSWCPPEVALVTAIGPVHLERMKTLEVVEAAKREITERASTVVLNVDDSRLATWVEPLRAQGKRVLTTGSRSEGVDVRVSVEAGRWTVVIDGVNVGSLDAVVGVQPTNLACAVGGALVLGVEAPTLLERARDVTPVANRLSVVTAPSGVVVVDDTFNANPASAQAALSLLGSLEITGRRVVVTPGLVELGSEQFSENLRLAQRVAALPAELVAVGRTNVVALMAGYEKQPQRFDHRDDAVAWVRSTLIPGDGVLYLNDLPDHYP
ncbi:MAG TPA: UDP-N-acetylmuramoyl-tripeptide--D-alanyl-D-alanine ligase [Acidimicrobiales bacterium]|jgi:UDP-N-acetylmuramoyl-tripeptide--D-alanyl-D-alanine ligase|nr:UDP-N-acetylmuramoyl-tripeptide--D-alanyl-D-alanine ligase [Acidimicrobiales bacterium]